MLDKAATGAGAPDQLRAMAFAIPSWPVGIWGLGAANELRWNDRAFEDLAGLGTEWVDFVDRRLKEDINLLPRLAACRCAEEVSNVYGEFWRKLGEDYSKEFAVLSKLSADFVASGFIASGEKRQS
jgi:hypothetical protein